MPINPEIALSVKPAQGPDVMDQLGRLASLSNMAQQHQIGAEQLQGARMENQQRTQDMADQEKMRAAWSQANGDPEQMLALASQAGVGAKTLLATQSALTQAAQARAKLNADQYDAVAKKNDLLHGLMQPVASEPDPVKQQQLWEAGIQSAVQQGLVTPDEAAQHPYPGPDGVKQYADSLTTDKWLTAQASQMRAVASQTSAKASADNAGAATAREAREAGQQEFQRAVGDLGANPPADAAAYRTRVGALAPGIASRIFGAVPPASYDPQTSPASLRRLGMTPDQQAQTQQAADNAALQARDSEVDLARRATDPTLSSEERAAAEAALKRLDKSKIDARPIIQNVLPGLPGSQGGAGAALTGETYLKTLSPGLAAQVRAIGEGRASMPSATTRSQAAIQLRDAVFQFDPSYSDQRAQVRKAFTSGPDGRNIGALNTATVHLDQFSDAAKALATGNFRPGNEAFNALKSTFGVAAPANFAALKAAVAGEMANALKGQATDPEIANISKSIDAANSPDQLAGVVETNLHILSAKLNTYRERYQQQIPGDQVWSPVLPSAQAVYDKRGVASRGGTLPQGGGKVIDPATAKSFYAAAGGDPNKARQLAAQAGWKVQ